MLTVGVTRMAAQHDEQPNPPATAPGPRDVALSPAGLTAGTPERLHAELRANTGALDGAPGPLVRRRQEQ